MGKGWGLEIIYFNKIDSTQKYLLNNPKMAYVFGVRIKHMELVVEKTIG